MVVIGLLLVLAAIAAGVLAVYGLPHADAHPISWDVFGNSASLSPTTLFFIGALSAVALALGLWLMSLGARRGVRKRRELHQLRRDQKAHDRVGHEHGTTTRTETERLDERGTGRGTTAGHVTEERVLTTETDEGRDGASGWRSGR